MHNNQNFSSCKRDALIDDLAKKPFDILIIGGGITGAGIALDASSRGLMVALVEKSDFASGTSSRSTKLIHGGLRYLQQLKFRFVAQLGKERKLIHANAQNNVLPTPVLLPIYKGGKLNKVMSFLGLFIYDVLAGVSKEYRTKWIKSKDILSKYNFVEKKGLKGAFLYYEYKTNDGRLVLETLKKANSYGAICLNYCEAKSLQIINNKAEGVIVIDNIKRQEFSVLAKSIVNATGVWCNSLMHTFGLDLPKKTYPTKGVHITFTKSRFPLKDAFYFDTHDGRMIFAIPRQNNVYVGTTDVHYKGKYESPGVQNTEMAYLLRALNLKFPKLELYESDVVSCWAGLRPLLVGKGKTPSEISRREELFIHKNGIITITGGKLTGYRLMAKKVVDTIISRHNIDKVNCKTASIKLSGGEYTKLLNSNELVEQADRACDEAKQTGISATDFKVLYYRYGTNIGQITEKAYELMTVEREPEKLWLMAEMWYAVNFEMLIYLSDFFIHRTEMVLFEPDKVERLRIEAANILAELLALSEEEKHKELQKWNEQWRMYKIK